MDINKRSRAELKQYFVKNAIPTEKQFADLIDGLMSLKDDGITKLAGNPLCIEASGDDTSQKKILHLYNSFSDTDPTWVLSLNPRQDPSKPDTAKAGLNISDSAGNSRLFIDKTSGNVGIGTISPTVKLDVAGTVRANRFTSDNALALNDYTTVNPSSNVYLYSPPNDRDAWIYLDSAGTFSNWGIYHRQIDSSVNGLPSNAIGFVGASRLQAYINLGDGSAYHANRLGIGTTDPQGMLDVRVPGTADGWDRFVVNTTSAWGDGANQFVTIGAGGSTGIMIWNPHIPWIAAEGRASIRYGRSGGVSSGAWWDAGVRAGNAFSIALNGGDHKLWIEPDGRVKIPGRLDVSVGAAIQSIGICTQIHGATTYPYETIQMDPSTNLRIWFGRTERFYFGHNGDMAIEGAWFKMRGAGDEQPYLGADGLGSDVQIGSTNPAVTGLAAYNTVSGYMHFYCFKLHETSDERMKESIETIDGSLEKILRLRCVSYNWRNDDQRDIKQRNIGLIAQEVRQIVPEAVSETRGLLSISYNSITALLVNAVQEQQRQIDELRTLVNKQVG